MQEDSENQASIKCPHEWSSVFMLLMFGVHEVGCGLYVPILNSYLHAHISSAERATLASFQSMAHYVGGMIWLVVSGLLAKYVSIHVTLLMLGVVALMISIIVIVRLRSVNNV